jgi:hypothetical protein
MRAGYNGFSIGSFHKIQSKKEAEREAAKNIENKSITNKHTLASVPVKLNEDEKNTITTNIYTKRAS